MKEITGLDAAEKTTFPNSGFGGYFPAKKRDIKKKHRLVLLSREERASYCLCFKGYFYFSCIVFKRCLRGKLFKEFWEF